MDFNILGPLEVRDDRGELSLGGGKQRALLALLLIHANESLSTDRLIGELWDEAPPPTAAKILQNHVSQLRRVLGADRLQTQARGYALGVEPGELDLDRFRQRLEEGRRAQAAGDPERASQLLHEALELWRGPPLADFAYEAFAREAIARLGELHLTAVIERVDADLALGRGSDLVGELESLVDEHPFQERLIGQLMLALYRSGRQAEALQVYQRARQMLAEELGIEPSQALQHLERAILVHDPSLEPPAIAKSAAVPPATVRKKKGSRVLLVVVALLLASAIAVAEILLTRGGGSKPIATSPQSTITVIDPKTNKPVTAIPVSNLPVRIAANSEEVLAMSSFGETVTRIDPKSMSVANTFAVAPSATTLSSIALEPDYGWVAYNGTVARITALSTGAQAIPFESNGQGDLPDVAIGRGSVWLTSQVQQAVIRVDETTLRAAHKVPIPAVPLAIAVTSEAVWVVGFDKPSKTGVLVRIDPKRSTVSEPIRFPGIPGALATGYGAVWVTVASENTVWRIDPATNSVVQTIRVGSGPSAVAVGAGAIWIANAKGRTVSRINPATNRVAATIQVGGSPRDVAVGSGRVWIAVP